jgi:hypothetical protein
MYWHARPSLLGGPQATFGPSWVLATVSQSSPASMTKLPQTLSVFSVKLVHPAPIAVLRASEPR